MTKPVLVSVRRITGKKSTRNAASLVTVAGTPAAATPSAHRPAGVHPSPPCSWPW